MKVNLDIFKIEHMHILKCLFILSQFFSNANFSLASSIFEASLVKHMFCILPLYWAVSVVIKYLAFY